MGENKFMVMGIALAGLALLFLVKKEGAAERLGQDAGEAVVNLVDGAAVGVVNGVSKEIGIPTTSELITDPVEAQAYRDQYGWWQAMGHLTASAYWGTH